MATILAVLTVYGLLNLFVTAVTSLGTEIGAIFWPGAGVSLAALLVLPRRDQPVLLAGLFAVEVAADLSTGFGWKAAVSFGIANCAEPLVAATLLRRAGAAPPDLGRLPGLFHFFVAAVLIGPALGALVGTSLPALWTGDPWLPRLPRWFIGDAVGVVVVAPFLLAYRRSGRDSWREHLLLFGTLAVVMVTAVGPWAAPAKVGLEYLIIPLLVLVALRSGTAGAAAAMLGVAILTETVSALSAGPFSEGAAGGGLLGGQLFLAMCAFTALTMAALTNDLLARERSEATLRAQALHDSLTGLGNRRLFDERLRHALAGLARRPGQVAVLCVDLDGFKAVNDRFGHPAGDAVLIATARRLEGATRETDTAVRLGGDEFFVLAEGLSHPDEAAQLASRVRQALAQPVEWQGADLCVGASVGFALTSDPGADRQRLMAEADRAMYRTKPRRREIVLPEAEPGLSSPPAREEVG